MPYNEVSKKSTMKYIKDKQQRLYVNYRKEDYDERIKPAIEKSGMPTATFIKRAIEEKIERDRL